MFQLCSHRTSLFAQVFLSTLLMTTTCFLYSQQDNQQGRKEQYWNLLKAIRRNEGIIVQEIIGSSGREILNAEYEPFGTPLGCAIYNENFEIVYFLLKSGADINGFQSGGTCLSYVLERGKLGGAKFLIENGANVSLAPTCGTTSLHVLATRGLCAKIIPVLLKNGADVNAQDQWGSTPLHCAVKTDHLFFVRILVEMGADIHTRNDSGDTPYAIALELGNVRILKYLHEQQARLQLTEILKKSEFPTVLQKLVYDLIFDKKENRDWLPMGVRRWWQRILNSD